MPIRTREAADLPGCVAVLRLRFCPGQPVRGYIDGYVGPPIRSAAPETGTLAAFAVSYGARNAGAHSSAVEHSPYKRGGAGSNPAAPTRQNNLVRDVAVGHRVTN